MDEEKPKEATEPTEANEKEEEEKKEPEEEPTCILKNPSRVLTLQERHISYIPENRYKAILEVIFFLIKTSNLTKKEQKERLCFPAGHHSRGYFGGVC